MSGSTGGRGTTSDGTLVAALAACCVGPMLLILVLVSVLGVAVGHAAAITLGLVAAGVCVAVMIQRHRRHGPESRSAPRRVAALRPAARQGG